MIQENIQYNNKSIHDTTKTANDNATIKLTNMQSFIQRFKIR